MLAAEVVDLHDHPVVELEQAQSLEADLLEHARRGDVLDTAAADQLVEAAAPEGLVAELECDASVAIPSPQRDGSMK